MKTGTEKTPSAFLVIIAFAIVYIVWGSTYFFIKMAVQGGLPPFLTGALRYTVAGLILMAWCIIKGEKIFVGRNIFHAAICGFLLLFIANGTVTWSEQTLPSAMVAIILSCPPIWIVLFDKKNWGVNFKSKSTIIGMVIGFAGVLLLFSEQIESIFTSSSHNTQLPWMLLLLIGTLGFGLGSLYYKYNLTTGSAPVNTAWQMIAGGLIFLPASFLHHEFNNLHLQSLPASSWFGLSYLIFFGSVAAFSAYIWLLKVRPATQVSTYAYVNPVIAVILGVLFADENISWMQLVGLFIILGSVFLMNLSKYRKEKPEKAKRPENKPKTETKFLNNSICPLKEFQSCPRKESMISTR